MAATPLVFSVRLTACSPPPEQYFRLVTPSEQAFTVLVESTVLYVEGQAPAEVRP